MHNVAPTNNMVRTNIYLTQRQMEFLRKEALESGLRVAEIVRRALDEYYARNISNTI